MEVDLKMAADGPSELLKALPERDDTHLCFRVVLLVQHQHADAPHPFGRLCAGRQWGSHDCRATEQGDERAPPHSITSSARASSIGGTSSPSALAVCRLITSSNVVGCKIGSSLGFAPLRTRA